MSYHTTFKTPSPLDPVDVVFWLNELRVGVEHDPEIFNPAKWDDPIEYEWQRARFVEALNAAEALIVKTNPDKFRKGAPDDGGD